MKTAVVLDVETCLLDGSPSLEYYRPDFRAISCAFAWRRGNEIATFHAEGEESIQEALRFFDRKSTFLVCHNFAFEYGVLFHRFPGYEVNLEVDTMRLVQNWDGGGKFLDNFVVRDELSIEDEMDYLLGNSTYETGLSLQASASRILPKEMHKHKKKYQDLIIQRGGKKSDLNLLTPEELREYNIADVEVTMALYEFLTEEYSRIGFDWTKDHFLYKSTARQTVYAKSRGIKVDRPKIEAHVAERQRLIAEMQKKFTETFGAQIHALESMMLEEAIAQYKTEAKQLQIALNPPRFNPRSTKQKKRLFVDIMGMVPKFFTKKAAPSFASKFSKQWGEGGEILKKQQTYALEQKQGENLYLLSEWDGRWHLDLKVAATKSGRLAGGTHG